MKLGRRNFTKVEKILLVALVVILIGLAYYKFVDQPVREAISIADADYQQAESELTVLQAQIAEMEKMKSEMDEVENGGYTSYMASYNNSAAELSELNEVLSETIEYTISFSDVTRAGNQICRNFSLAFSVKDYSAMEKVVEDLSFGEYRCLVKDIRCSTGKESVTVNATATFYETMVGGVTDAGLPEDSSAPVVETEAAEE